MTSPTGDERAQRTPSGDPASAGPDISAFVGVSNPPAPARLTVGILSAGRVGTALGAALERAGHVVGAVVARSPESKARVADRLPDSQILDLPDVVARAELMVLSVPDDQLAHVVGEVAASGALRPRTLVAHTAGAHGVAVLEPLTALGALPMAIHPAMTFVGTDDDTARLPHACFGVTAADEVGDAIASTLVLEMGGEPVRIAEADRVLYHAALAHGANHLVALISDAVAVLNAAIDGTASGVGTAGDVGGRRSATVEGTGEMLAERILGPLVGAALQNVLELGPRAFTGPAARGDAQALADHLDALRALPGGTEPDSIAEAYRALARRAVSYTDAPAAVHDVLEAP